MWLIQSNELRIPLRDDLFLNLKRRLDYLRLILNVFLEEYRVMEDILNSKSILEGKSKEIKYIEVRNQTEKFVRKSLKRLFPYRTNKDLNFLPNNQEFKVNEKVKTYLELTTVF